MTCPTEREEELKRIYRLSKHPEGGFFSEAYTSPFSAEGRPCAGSIYFLLGKGEISRLHEIDCDEIWYYHEGCGMRITVLTNDGRKECLLGMRADLGERAMAVIPAGAAFASENLSPDGYTFVSCVTSPKFMQSGFHEIDRRELEKRFPGSAADSTHLAF